MTAGEQLRDSARVGFLEEAQAGGWSTATGPLEAGIDALARELRFPNDQLRHAIREALCEHAKEMVAQSGACRDMILDVTAAIGNVLARPKK